MSKAFVDPFKKHLSLEAAQALSLRWKQKGERIVFTNGVFDILHPGHVIYLQQAADLGSKLIVGLNADASVRLLNKGPERPIQSQEARATILSALSMVDAIILFEEETPIDLIKRIQPDILVKGGDYTIEQIVGADEVRAQGGQVKMLQFIDGYSTTSIEQKIKRGR